MKCSKDFLSRKSGRGKKEQLWEAIYDKGVDVVLVSHGPTLEPRQSSAHRVEEGEGIEPHEPGAAASAPPVTCERTTK